MGRPRNSDAELWRAAMRGVKPIAARKTAPAPEPAPHPLPTLPRLAGEGMGGGIDRRSFEKLKRGQLAIEDRLDLHGLTQAEAHRALSRFLRRAAEQGLRQVLVITGKGGAGKGVLRAAVPLWLEEESLRRHVLAATPAQPRDGGAGALYLRLRRARRP